LKQSDGGSTDYYKIPAGATDLQDLIEAKSMSFGRGNIFKAAYRLGEDGNDEVYDLKKIIWFAQRRLNELTVQAPSPDPWRMMPPNVDGQQACLRGHGQIDLKSLTGTVIRGVHADWALQELPLEKYPEWRPTCGK